MAQPKPRVLFLSKSSGFEHASIAREGGPSHVELVLARIAEEHGFDLVSTKDAGLISSEGLESFDAVVFYTTGDLTERGGGDGLFAGDGEPAMSETGVAELRAWIEAGGGFLGFHPASDTFHGPEDTVSPYTDLLGGQFLGHGRQFEGRLRIVDPEHPTMARIPADWTVKDEWYTFKNVREESMHVLALLDTSSDTFEQEIYDRDDYPIIWCRSFGAGRVFYNAMGHREDVWDNEIFRAAFVDALYWAIGRSDLDAAPNFAEFVGN